MEVLLLSPLRVMVPRWATVVLLALAATVVASSPRMPSGPLLRLPVPATAATRADQHMDFALLEVRLTHDLKSSPLSQFLPVGAGATRTVSHATI